jgi:P27 family predicted phage terminase small subunit
LKLLRGNPGKRPIRPEPEPAVPTTPPDPPEFLDEHAKNEWWRVAPKLHALGSLTVLDLQPLAAYCQAYAHWITAERALARMAADDPRFSSLMINGNAGSLMVNPLVRVCRNAAADMLRFAAEFGMTPVARSRLSVAGRTSGPGKFYGLLPDQKKRFRLTQMGRMHPILPEHIK